jgi:hypothetical protein
MDFLSYQASGSKKNHPGRAAVAFQEEHPGGVIPRLPPLCFQRWGICLLLGFVLGGVGLVSAEMLMATDFESGTLAGWTTFPTSNGTLGGEGFPSVAVCDYAGMVAPSRCLKVQVGQLHYAPAHEAQQGGGIEMTQQTRSGMLQLSALVGVTYHSPNKKKKRNLSGGLFEWVVDDHVVARLDVGPIEHGVTVHQNFTGTASVTEGSHLLQLRMTRPFQSGTDQPAPVQFVDDIRVELIAHP